MFEDILNFTYYLLQLTVEYEVLKLFWYFMIITGTIMVFRKAIHL